MRKLLPLLVLSLLAMPALAQTLPDDHAGIAATVNDEVITKSDVEGRLELYLSGAPTQPPPEIRRRIEGQVLDKLIDEKLEMQQAKSLGITVPQDEINKAFEQVAGQNHFSADDFKKKLAGMHIRTGTLYDQIKAEIAWSQVVRRKLRPQINVSESDIDSTIDQQARAHEKSQYHVAEIFLAVPSPALDNEVRKKALALGEQISGGAHFSDVARQFSQAPGAAAGGDLGWVQEGQLDEKIDDALKKMQPGQISPPIRTDKGYSIVFLRDMQAGKEAASPAPRQQDPTAPPAAPGIVVHLKQILIPIAPNDPPAIVEAKATRAASLKSEIKSCDEMDKKSKDFSTEGTGDLGKVSMDALPQVLKDALAPLRVGELSGPVRNDKGIAVVMVCERETPPADTSSAPIPKFNLDKTDQASRENVANKIGMQRLDMMQERYLRDLRASAFIDKRI